MRIFSGIQPSGNLHIGNYLGAIQQFVKLQDEGDALYCIVDLHAITVPQQPEELRRQTIEAAAMYLACGLDPKKAIIFVQSHVKEHTELTWILNTITTTDELERMTQFKSKAGLIEDLKTIKDNLQMIMKDEKTYLAPVVAQSLLKYIDTKGKVSMGLFDYPVLMAADILLYQTNTVPVGEDQKQHVELTRDLAKRFNHRFGETFVVPDVKLQKNGARIMGLDDPAKKMSKSASSSLNYIALADTPDTIRKKIGKAVTDSGSEVKSGKDKPALTNLLTIMSLLSNTSVPDLEKSYEGKGYGVFKKDLAEVIVEHLTPIQRRYHEIIQSQNRLETILHDGAKNAQTIATKTMKTVRERMGLL